MAQMLEAIRARLPLWLDVWLPIASDAERELEIKELQQKIRNGSRRLACELGEMRHAWFPEILRPTSHDWFVSSGQPVAAPREIVEDYFEERKLLREAISVPDDQWPTADWQDESKKWFWAPLNKDAYAANNWEAIAVPVRYHEGHVYRIWPAPDLLDDPIVTKIAVEDFVSASAKNSARQAFELAREKMKVRGLLTLLFISLFGVSLKLISTVAQ